MYLGWLKAKVVPMLRKEDFVVIKTLHRRGVSIEDIAEELDVHPKTVSRALKRNGAPNPERERWIMGLAPPLLPHSSLTLFVPITLPGNFP